MQRVLPQEALRVIPPSFKAAFGFLYDIADAIDQAGVSDSTMVRKSPRATSGGIIRLNMHAVNGSFLLLL